MGRGSFPGVEFVVVAGVGVVEVGTVAGGADDGGILVEKVCLRPSRGGLCRPGESRAAARAGRTVDKGGSEFAGPRGWFVSNRGKAIGDVLHVLILVVGVVVGVFR